MAASGQVSDAASNVGSGCSHQTYMVEDDASQIMTLSERTEGKRIYDVLKAKWTKCGGPQQYLYQMMPKVEDKAAFATWLWDVLPECDDSLYTHSVPLPTVTERDMGSELPLLCHLAAFSFQPSASLKPPPDLERCLPLLHRILTIEGFTTAKEPLIGAQ